MSMRDDTSNYPNVSAIFYVESMPRLIDNAAVIHVAAPAYKSSSSLHKVKSRGVLSDDYDTGGKHS
jgi:hypothetical protein